MKEKSRLGMPAISVLLLLASFHVLVIYLQSRDFTSLGLATNQSSPEYGRFLGTYLFFGAAAVLALTVLMLRWSSRGGWAERLVQRFREGSDRSFVLMAMLLALLLSLLCRDYLMLKMPLADDEGVYRFAAQILAKGRLYLPADPDAAFFRHNLTVHGEKIFTQYFLGWPALMLPFLLLGLEGYANAFYFALTIPAIFLVVRRLCGTGWARLGVLLTLSSPTLVISAATLLSHTSCIAALSWFVYCALRCRDPDAGASWHAGMAASFSLAFFIRPLSALAIGLPFLLAWLLDLRQQERPLRAFLAFTAPALFGATLFLTVNQAMNGHPLRTAYESYLVYLADGKPLPSSRVEMTFISLEHSLAVAAAAFQRLNFAALGWPFSWLFVFAAGKGRFRTLLLWTFPCFFAANFFTTVVGIDTYAPMHYLELVLPMVLLTVFGIERTTHFLHRAAPESPSLAAVPSALSLACVAIASLAFLPYQALALRGTAQLEAITRNGAKELELPALVFVLQPYPASSCDPENLKSWVHQWPVVDPDLTDEVLWLAHISVEKDRDLARRRFPGRTAYISAWQKGICQRIFLPIEEATDEIFPPIRGRVVI